jgi:hypothetical protein
MLHLPAHGLGHTGYTARMLNRTFSKLLLSRVAESARLERHSTGVPEWAESADDWMDDEWVEERVQGGNQQALRIHRWL